ncbi:acetolactate decarboxylase [Serratia sp. NPDC078593]|uniref:acetolactate decarboxylase n=1 Tax=unclassified Serratia (in: enterobacteria) TaxID=2647522 RepID=UPI0037D05360
MSQNHGCSCAQHLAQGFTQQSVSMGEGEIYQISLMSALIGGVYEGDVTIAELMRHGDFGLGTFNQLDGELIAFDKEIYQLRADGSARPASLAQKTPFAVVTFFKPSVTHYFDKPIDKAQLHQCIDEQVASPNLFCALRVDGEFSHVETRTVPRQERPYKPMLEAIEAQPTFAFQQSQGTLVGFRSPDYMQGIGVAGYHEHFVTDDRNGGGHVLDYQLDHGRLQFGVITRLNLQLPHDADFLRTNLSPEGLDRAIRSAEG